MEIVGINVTRSAVQLPSLEKNVASLSKQAMHQNELTYCPIDCIDGLFSGASIVIQ